MNDDAIRFLSNIFGLQSLKYYVGEITFFNELCSKMETQSRCGGALVCNTNIATSGDSPSNRTVTSLWTPLKSRVERTHRGGTTAPPLLEKCKAFSPLVDKSRYLVARQQTRCEVKSISQSLSFGLLENIHTAILNASENEKRAIRNAPPARRIDIHSMLQDIKALQTKIDAAVDDDEQRALEEDATGRVLWICWCGILSEVEQRLPEIVNYILREGNLMTPQRRDRLHQGLQEVGEIIKKTPHVHVDDDLAHLRRIMLDAEADISKYQLWHTARLADLSRDASDFFRCDFIDE
ncbi:hypothetical protein EDC04DRAFT_2796396 [Pisolithus marmoratus]|nr:hypothetical protein EDC04DRAFT_2796396 [Pisolithus marmoratus]